MTCPDPLNNLAVALLALCYLTASAAPFRPFQDPGPDPWTRPPQDPGIYALAVRGTCVPADLLRAVAMVESDELDHAIGDGGRSRGRMQINEVYRAERISLFGGEYDPHNPYDATRLAALILDRHYQEFGDWPRAVSAYNQGSWATRRRGVRREYLRLVESALGRSL